MVFDAFITTEGEPGECFRERVTILSLFFLPVYKFVMPARVSVLLGNKRALHADALQVVAIGIVISSDVHRAYRSGNQGDIDQ